MEPLIIEFSETLDSQIQDLIHQGFAEHMVEQTHLTNQFIPFAFVAKRGATFLGAVIGKYFFGGLHIKELFVIKEERGKGLGTKLMHTALAHGKEQSCAFAWLETFNFQAVEFYKKLGFEVEFIRTGYNGNNSFYYLCKDLR